MNVSPNASRNLRFYQDPMHKGTLFQGGAKSDCHDYRKPAVWQAFSGYLLAMTPVYNCFGNLP
jgi:hypothetical protein